MQINPLSIQRRPGLITTALISALLLLSPAKARADLKDLKKYDKKQVELHKKRAEAARKEAEAAGKRAEAAGKRAEAAGKRAEAARKKGAAARKRIKVAQEGHANIKEMFNAKKLFLKGKQPLSDFFKVMQREFKDANKSEDRTDNFGLIGATKGTKLEGVIKTDKKTAKSTWDKDKLAKLGLKLAEAPTTSQTSQKTDSKVDNKPTPKKPPQLALNKTAKK